MSYSAHFTPRGLDSFSRDQPKLGTELQLPDWNEPTKLAYPPPRVPLNVVVAQSMASNPLLPRPLGPEYAGARAAAVREEQARVANFYDEQARQRKEREDAEARERANRLAGKT